MKKLVFMAIALMLMTAAASAATLTVTVSNCDSDQGCVSVALYNLDTRQQFGSGSGYYQGRQGNIHNGTATVAFPDLPDGTYAVVAFHDLECRGVLPTNFWGIPQAKYGFSNNYGKRPDFSLASFPVSGDMSLAIRLQWY